MKDKFNEKRVRILPFLVSIMHPTAMTSVASYARCDQMAVTKSYQHELAECDLE